MLYDYKCKKCDKTWEESHPVDNRDVPCGKPCPCGSNGTVFRPMSAPGLNFEGSVGKISKTGNFK
jgi:putative FmdB family regulatory protein